MSQIEEKLHSLGHTLPPPPAGAGNYLPFRRAGNLLFLSGSISVQGDGTLVTGKAGGDKSVQEAYESAAVCVLNQLAVVKAAVGSLDAIKQVVMLNGYVNVAPEFVDIPQVINGASDLLVALFGRRGPSCAGRGRGGVPPQRRPDRSGHDGRGSLNNALREGVCSGPRNARRGGLLGNPGDVGNVEETSNREFAGIRSVMPHCHGALSPN